MCKKGRPTIGDRVKFGYWTEDMRERGKVVGLSPGELIVQHDETGQCLRIDVEDAKKL